MQTSLITGVSVHSAHLVICTTQPSDNLDTSTSLLHLEQIEETDKSHFGHDIVCTFSIFITTVITCFWINLKWIPKNFLK